MHWEMILLFALFIPVGLAHSQTESESGLSSRQGPLIQLTQVKIHCATSYVDTFRDGGTKPLVAGDQPEWRAVQLLPPTWATSLSSVFTYEDYVFSGGSSAQVDYRTIVTNNAGPRHSSWPLPGKSVGPARSISRRAYPLRDIDHRVPPQAPLEQYDYWTQIGIPPSTPYDEDRFTFRIVE